MDLGGPAIIAFGSAPPPIGFLQALVDAQGHGVAPMELDEDSEDPSKGTDMNPAGNQDVIPEAPDNALPGREEHAPLQQSSPPTPVAEDHKMALMEEDSDDGSAANGNDQIMAGSEEAPVQNSAPLALAEEASLKAPTNVPNAVLLEAPKGGRIVRGPKSAKALPVPPAQRASPEAAQPVPPSPEAVHVAPPAVVQLANSVALNAAQIAQSAPPVQPVLPAAAQPAVAHAVVRRRGQKEFVTFEPYSAAEVQLTVIKAVKQADDSKEALLAVQAHIERAGQVTHRCGTGGPVAQIVSMQIQTESHETHRATIAELNAMAEKAESIVRPLTRTAGMQTFAPLGRKSEGRCIVETVPLLESGQPHRRGQIAMLKDGDDKRYMLQYGDLAASECNFSLVILNKARLDEIQAASLWIAQCSGLHPLCVVQDGPRTVFALSGPMDGIDAIMNELANGTAAKGLVVSTKSCWAHHCSVHIVRLAQVPNNAQEANQMLRDHFEYATAILGANAKPGSRAYKAMQVLKSKPIIGVVTYNAAHHKGRVTQLICRTAPIKLLLVEALCGSKMAKFANATVQAPEFEREQKRR